ncbi:MAG: hypothetical protein ACHP7N_09985 [Caulobacterales bacterium]
MMRHTAVALCVALFVTLAASRAFSQTYIPSYQQIQDAIAEEQANQNNNGCSTGGGVKLVGGRITGVDASKCPALANFANNFQLSQLYGQFSILVDVSGRPFVDQTFNGTTVYDETYFNNLSTMFNNLFPAGVNGAPLVIGSSNGFTYTGTEALDATVKFLGLRFTASFAANDTTLHVSLPDLTKFGPNGYQLTGTGATREAAFQNLGVVAKALPAAQVQDVEQSILAFWERTQTTDPLAGNPASVQGIAVRNAMDLTNDDSVLDSGSGSGGGGESASAKGADAGSWMVGFAYGRSFQYGPDTNTIDANVQKSWRVFQGDRSRLQLSIPVSYSDAYGTQQFQGGAALGLEVPMNANWSLEPQISWGVALSNKLQSMGHMIVASVTSRYRIDGFSRGYFIIGNMVGYTTTLSTGAFGTDLNPGISNWVFRNGVAYELPLDMMVFGRGSSVRASYVYTNFTGSPLAVERFHEVAISFGVRSREGQLHNTFEAFRIGISNTWSNNYEQLSVLAGFRF